MRRIGLLLFPGITQLDLTGPYEVFSRLPETEVLLVAETEAPVRSEYGMLISPNRRRDDCPALDVLCIPGGGGIQGLMESDAWLDFVALQGQKAMSAPCAPEASFWALRAC